MGSPLLISVSDETLTSVACLCQVRQGVDKVATMIRPAWSPETDEQRRALAKAIKRAQLAAKADAAMWEAIVEARNVGVPDTLLCDETGQSRATLNRKFGARSTANSPAVQDDPA
jgi:hypothetical protein